MLMVLGVTFRNEAMGLGATRRLFRICRRLLCRWLVQTAERIFHKRPNKSATNDRTKSQQTTEKVSKDLYNSIINSIFAAKLSNKRKMTICVVAGTGTWV